MRGMVGGVVWVMAALMPSATRGYVSKEVIGQVGVGMCRTYRRRA